MVQSCYMFGHTIIVLYSVYRALMQMQPVEFRMLSSAILITTLYNVLLVTIMDCATKITTEVIYVSVIGIPVISSGARNSTSFCSIQCRPETLWRISINYWSKQNIRQPECTWCDFSSKLSTRCQCCLAAYSPSIGMLYTWWVSSRQARRLHWARSSCPQALHRNISRSLQTPEAPEVYILEGGRLELLI